MKASGNISVSNTNIREKVQLNLGVVKLGQKGSLTYRKNPKTKRGIRTYKGINVMDKHVGAGLQLNTNGQGLLLSFPGMNTKFIGFGKPKKMPSKSVSSRQKTKSVPKKK